MSTVGAIIDRIYVDYLSNPTDTPVQAKVQAAITDVQTTIVYAAELAIEEQDLLTAGTIIELELELCRVTAHTPSTRTLTVTRGVYGTTAAAHGSATLMRVAPKWPRISVFNAVADEIVGLYPMLYAVGEEWAGYSDLMVEIDDAYAMNVLEARQLVAGQYEEIECTMARVAAATDSGLVAQFQTRSTGDVFIRYTKRFPRPTAESDTFTTLGIDESWEPILIFGALSSLIGQTDIDAMTQEFVTESLQNQGYRPTTATSLAVAMGRLRADHLRRAADRLKARDPIHTSYNRVL